MSPPRRLTNDEAFDVPYGWTADSKRVLGYSFRDGFWSIFTHAIGQESAEAVVKGLAAEPYPRLSADGAWIIYKESLKTPVSPSTPVHLMRIPVGGGVPQPVLETPDPWNYECARAPASLCVITEVSQDQKKFTFTALDPVKGRGKVLRTVEKNPSVHFAGSALSPDGTTVAISQGGEAEIHIRLLSLSGGSDREITVKVWPNITGLDWSHDGKGLYVGSVSPQGDTILYVDLKGHTWVLWQQKGGVYTWGAPSPDGRYLAILGGVTNSNVWMLEGF
jgi:Tol biopolymer transport system component